MSKFKVGDEAIRMIPNLTHKRKMFNEIAIVKIINNDDRSEYNQAGWCCVDYGNGTSIINEKSLFTKEEAQTKFNEWLSSSSS